MSYILTPYRRENLPPSLHPWFDFCAEAERLENRGQQHKADALYPKIEKAWEDAPLRDRITTDAKGLYAVWAERHAWKEAEG